MKESMFFLVIILFTTCGESDEAYIKQTLETIESRNRYLKFNESSPFKTANMPFSDPKYFEINKEYRVEAIITKVKDKSIRVLPQSDGSTIRYEKYAILSFKLKGKKQELSVYRPVGFGTTSPLFCAFTDSTSGQSTYEGGRYLDITIGKSTKTVLDFNLAYNPYCAYVDLYVCPLPPAENHILEAIEAGERVFQKNIE